jgi:hypothetical protein
MSLSILPPEPFWKTTQCQIDVQAHLDNVEIALKEVNENRQKIVTEEGNVIDNFSVRVTTGVNDRLKTLFQDEIKRVNSSLSEMESFIKITDLMGSRSPLSEETLRKKGASLKSLTFEEHFELCVNSTLKLIPEIQSLLSLRKSSDVDIRAQSSELFDDYIIRFGDNVTTVLERDLLKYSEKSPIKMEFQVSRPIFIGELKHLRGTKEEQDDYSWNYREQKFNQSKPTFRTCECKQHMSIYDPPGGKICEQPILHFMFRKKCRLELRPPALNFKITCSVGIGFVKSDGHPRCLRHLRQSDRSVPIRYRH